MHTRSTRFVLVLDVFVILARPEGMQWRAAVRSGGVAICRLSLCNIWTHFDDGRALPCHFRTIRGRLDSLKIFLRAVVGRAKTEVVVDAPKFSCGFDCITRRRLLLLSRARMASCIHIF